MAVQNSAYCNLRDEIISSCECSDLDLQTLKSIFKDQINSTRRTENISNMRELIRLLEKRNAINMQDMNCLKRIVKVLHREDLLALINGEREIQQPVPLPPQRTPVLPPVLPRSKRDKIYDLIITQIGQKWKDLARNLGIGEGQIDEMEERYRFDPPERVRKILQYHEHNSLSSRVWYELMDALYKSRRSDLKDKVQNILAGN